MATISRFEELEIGQLARKQCKEIFELYSGGSFLKDFELINQINRSSGSVMDNIAEGFERSGNKEFIHFILIAKGSNGEVRSQFHRMIERHYVTEQKSNELILQNETLSKKNKFVYHIFKSFGEKRLSLHVNSLDPSFNFEPQTSNFQPLTFNN